MTAVTAMDTSMDRSLLRLLHLVSPNLPTGSFSYSQGLEWTVENGWIHDTESFTAWLLDLLHNSMGRVDIPLLKRIYQAIQSSDWELLGQHCDLLSACRESSEMQEEEQTRGRALATLMASLDLLEKGSPIQILKRSQLAGYVFMATRWNISLEDAATGYIWSWLENQVITGIKIIPLGQTQGQQLLTQLSDSIIDCVEQGFSCADDDIGAASPALALACSLHESQYSRLYRS